MSKSAARHQNFREGFETAKNALRRWLLSALHLSALLHESKLTRHDPDREALHRPML